MPMITRSLSCNKRYKLVYVDQGKYMYGIAELLIPVREGRNTESRKVVNNDYAVYRCDRAYVHKITSINGEIEFKKGYSIFKAGGYYNAGEWIMPDQYDNDIENASSYGIHYYMTRDAAVNLFLHLYQSTFHMTISNYNIQLYNPFLVTAVQADDHGDISMKFCYNEKGFLEKILYIGTTTVYDEDISVVYYPDNKRYSVSCFGEEFMDIPERDLETIWNV